MKTTMYLASIIILLYEENFDTWMEHVRSVVASRNILPMMIYNWK